VPRLARIGWAYPAAVLHVKIGGSAGCVTVDVLGREHPTATDYDDGNWLLSQVSVEAGAWNGRFRASLRAEEFGSFLRGVRLLYDSLEGTAEFVPMEPWLILKLEGDRLGHVAVSGVADDEVATGNKLSLHFEIDQSYLPSVIRELEAVLAEFPVVGEPRRHS
jgi:hypothetical protein